MKSRTWKVWFRFSLGLAIAWLCSIITLTSVDAQSLSGLLPKDAIAPTQSKTLNQSTANLDGFIPSKLRQSESPMGSNRSVIGEDQRQPLMSREYPWSTIGKIVMLSKSGNEYSCTGTMIGKSLVLTNAHCVYDKNQLFPKMFFLPNLINGRLRTKNDVAAVKNILTGTNKPNSQPADDWAILELNKPLGEKYGFLKWRSVPLMVLRSYKNKLAVAGYSGDYPDPKVYTELSLGEGYTAGVHLGCSVLGESEGMLVHDCDTNPGASGSALIGKIDGTYQIVGLHARGSKDRQGKGIENYAVQIARIEADLSKGK